MRNLGYKAKDRSPLKFLRSMKNCSLFDRRHNENVRNSVELEKSIQEIISNLFPGIGNFVNKYKYCYIVYIV